MHATCRAEAHKVKFLAALFYIIIYALDLSPAQKLVVTASLVDFHEILIYDTTCAEVHVSYLRVAHLSVREANSLAACKKMAHRIFGSERVNERCSRSIDGIGVVMFALSPSVENHKKNFSVHGYNDLIITILYTAHKYSETPRHEQKLLVSGPQPVLNGPL